MIYKLNVIDHYLVVVSRKGPFSLDRLEATHALIKLVYIACIQAIEVVGILAFKRYSMMTNIHYLITS